MRRADARRQGLVWYVPDAPCGYCGTVAARHVGSNMCAACFPPQRVRRSPECRDARAAGWALYVPAAPCAACGVRAPRRVQFDDCSSCAAQSGTSSPKWVRAAMSLHQNCGEFRYKCRACNKMTPHNSATLKCMECPDPNNESPRDEARDAGETAYKPAEPCRTCGVRAMRRVSTGECLRCHPARQPAQEKRTMPAEPCPQCGKKAAVSALGRCFGCHPRERRGRPRYLPAT